MRWPDVHGSGLSGGARAYSGGGAAYGSNGLEECAKAHELEGRVEHHVVCHGQRAS